MASKKIQLYTDRANTIEASPETSANCVILSDGNDLQKVLDNDLTNPTVVHEETSFKVGVGDIDVSSSVVDGEVGRMVIKGKTYQNILPEPSTHVLTNNKEMFKVNEGLDPNVEIVNAVSKSAILSGNTLVNKATVVGRSINAEGWNNLSVRINYPLSVNSKYLINVFNLPNDIRYVLTNSTDSNWLMPVYVNGKTVFTSQYDSDEFVVVHVNNPSTLRPLTQEEIDKLQVIIIEYQEGMENWDIPYFEGMQSVKMPVLTTMGVNIFEGETERGYIDSSTGQNSSAWNDLRSVGYTEVIGGNTIRILVTNESFSSPRIYEYDENKNFIGRVENNILSPHAKFVRFSIGGNTNIGGISQVMLYYGDDIKREYEPYKSNILTVNEPIELRGIGDVQDTLDLLTGEVTERIGEIVLDENAMGNNGIVQGTLRRFDITLDKQISEKIISDKLPVGKWNLNITINTTYEFIAYYNPTKILVGIESSKLSTQDLNGLRLYLQQNPIKLQYQLATESIKTVDLSSSGNWEKVVLDGSKDVAKHLSGNFAYYTYGDSSITNVLPYASGGRAFASHTLTGSMGVSNLVTNHKYIVSPKTIGTTGLCFSLDGSMTAEEAKAFLSQNPITVWYQTQTHQDSTQVKQPIFFKDGHIIQSSGTDNSLIPTLDYQAKTSNSYVMDLMKPNTKYTMKAKSASGTFTIDGTSYGAGTNGTFTTPSSMTNKFLVMSNNANEEVMIIEGDVTSKTIPYFKGIKSAFEDEDKIEVLSTDSNLLINNQRLQEEGVLYLTKGWSAVRLTTKAKKVKIVVKNKTGITGTKLNVKDDIESESNFMQLFAANEVFTTIEREYSLKNSNVISFCSYGSLTFSSETFFDNYDIEVYTLDNMDETLVVEKSNSTKIPLLSPLRSLPNGVCDELIIDRMKKKATLIQRVGGVALDGRATEQWTFKEAWREDGTLCFSTPMPEDMKYYGMNQTVGFVSDKFHPAFMKHASMFTGYLNTRTICLCLSPKIVSDNANSLKQWLQINPTIILYELTTPVVTEIDLESFPLVYKDGHIFLNSEIASVVEIDYNVNQAQQIQANNETLQRHELDILDLDNLIVSFVNAEYNLRLLKFDMELSMTALAE